ncbi:MAG: hypothetical protein RBS56_02665 [Candidatus Gracilibacteria bacterium]|jgi:hypothetical protein|nr:hypothetical protein [Candidatus Gracilibacteria bacterium]
MNKKTIISLSFLLLSILGFVFLYKPISVGNETLMADKGDLLAKKMEIENKLTLIEEQKADIEGVSDISLNVLKNAIPDKMQQDEVIRSLITISDENKVSLNSISFGKGGSLDNEVFVLRVNAGFDGGFSDLIRFLEGLESSKRKFTVNSISVQLASLTVGGVRKANFSLSMETYFFNE